ncbi:hypothetical protein GQ53DRAFT_749019 [Thozetella sp. PMI_491]|nr:hypothetical protein GQ53DRAFT_749019 [Thozetella sp. PMI_491]
MHWMAGVYSCEEPGVKQMLSRPQITVVVIPGPSLLTCSRASYIHAAPNDQEEAIRARVPIRISVEAVAQTSGSVKSASSADSPATREPRRGSTRQVGLPWHEG